jgi:tRNA (guanine37-N1)-methyltransferase
MRIDILTLFPDMFNGFLTESIIKRARENNLVEINVIDFRKYSTDPNNKVDDTPYGGGNGMVLMCQPIYDDIEAIKTADSKVIMLTPDGNTYNQSLAYDLSKEKHIILLCGHYEGFDERIKTIVDMEVSIGDYVLTGGEIPAMVLIDSVSRYNSGVIAEESIEEESFANGLLEYPQYTRPEVFEGVKVPEVLLSGHHANIEKWRKEKALEITKLKRPDLLK